MKLVALLALAGLVAAPTATDAGGLRARTVVVQTERASFRVPPGWHVAGVRSTKLVSPSERLLAASYRLPHPGKNSSCGPMDAVNAIPRDGVLVFVFEYAKRSQAKREDFPPRPQRFALPAGDQQAYECMGLSHAILFRDRGRLFQAHVALGPQAEPDVALRILDSLRVG